MSNYRGKAMKCNKWERVLHKTVVAENALAATPRYLTYISKDSKFNTLCFKNYPFDLTLKNDIYKFP